MSNWQPIETAPKDGTHILGYDGREMTVVYWCDYLEYWDLAVAGSYADDGQWWPKHWQPLPEAP